MMTAHLSDLLGRIKRLAFDRAGLAGVEFALLAPLMILLVFGSASIFDLTVKRQSLERSLNTTGDILSRMEEVEKLAADIAAKHDTLHIVINNAGILKTPATTTSDGFDVRFAVNTFAPALLTKRLLPLIPADGRVINLSSAAQSPVDLQALSTCLPMQDMKAYAQSKLALTIWSFHLGKELGTDGPAIIAVNPGSLMGSKMVKEGFGIAGKGLDIGAEILARAALSDDFAQATGQYFDNDIGQFGSPHPDALDTQKVQQVVEAIDAALSRNA